MHCTNCGQEIVPNAMVCPHCGFAVGTERKFCASCGQAIKPNQAICLSCGCALPPIANQPIAGPNADPTKTIHPSGKSSTLAAILSCLVVGVGQMYLGQVIKGVVMLLAALVIGPLTAGAAAPIIWIVAMIDAYMVGKKLEAGKSVGEWEFF